MKIAFIGARGVIGKYSGIETYYEEVGSRLVRLGHQVTAYCRSYFTPAVSTYRGLRIRRFSTVRSKHLETIVHSALCTADTFLRDYDIVQFHALGSAPLAWVPRLAGKKTVVSVRGRDGQRAKWNRFARGYLKACEWTSVRFPSATGVVSQTLRDYYARNYRADTVYLPNGVTLKPHRPADQIFRFGLAHKEYILFLGRLTPEKDCHTLIEAFRGLNSPLKLVFVGESTYADGYVRALKNNASEKIMFLGFQGGEILEELLSNAYLYVLPSRIEGLSISLLEAMGYGNCVLTSDIPENLEVVQGIGYTFRTGDASSLAANLDFLIRNPAKVEASGEAARGFIEKNYTWDVISLKTIQFYQELLSQQDGRRGNGAGPTNGDSSLPPN